MENCTMSNFPTEEQDRHFRNPDLPPDPPAAAAADHAEDEALPVVENGPQGLRKKIKTIGSSKQHEDEWLRTPNTTGSGAIHCRSFFTKLNPDSVSYMDQSINEWLDEHPQYEVKFVNSTIGTMQGKLGPQDVMICQVWV
ncbi:MAG: hypothetical protein CMJ24_11620 [Phycisphaerae bacterium]|nr:hypothetical protein [Phycisphaerae bacterium]|tara:strand:+ start:10222 stop:10641 length:420 start_codon:yes stop_codon:yes gene_type:complete